MPNSASVIDSAATGTTGQQQSEGLELLAQSSELAGDMALAEGDVVSSDLRQAQAQVKAAPTTADGDGLNHLREDMGGEEQEKEDDEDDDEEEEEGAEEEEEEMDSKQMLQVLDEVSAVSFLSTRPFVQSRRGPLHGASLPGNLPASCATASGGGSSGLGALSSEDQNADTTCCFPAVISGIASCHR